MQATDLYLIGNSFSSLFEIGNFLANNDQAYDLLVGFVKQFERSIEHRDITHSFRVALLAEILGESLELPEQEILNLKMSAHLHDIGKVFLPLAIFVKKGKLNLMEWSMIRLHPELGSTLLKQIPQLAALTTGLLSHHEKFNGSGYPFGLRGHEIPLFARIIGLVDCFEALTAPRVYHIPLSVHQALEKMRKQTNQGLWDPYLFNILEEMVENQDVLNHLETKDLEVIKN